MSNEVSVQRATADSAVPGDAEFGDWVAAVLAHRRVAGEITIRIVDAEEGRRLNATWRGRDAPTNVLAFPAGLPEELGLPLLGDLVLCAPVVAAEAAEQDKALAHHYAHLTIHGVLHLLGCDHQEPAEAELMEAEERRILAGLGINDPYQA